MYRSEEDPIAAFVAERCVLKQTARTTSASLYDAYETWCQNNGERPLGRRAFGDRLGERGCVAGQGNQGVRCWFGIGLLAFDDLVALVADGGSTSHITKRNNSHDQVNRETPPPSATYATNGHGPGHGVNGRVANADASAAPISENGLDHDELRLVQLRHEAQQRSQTNDFDAKWDELRRSSQRDPREPGEDG